jgi:polar amino acid transport system substrate-binding protein
MGQRRWKRMTAVGTFAVALTAVGASVGSAAPVRHTATTAFNPPPILKSVPASLKNACTSTTGRIASIKKAGTLNWAIGVSPPFGFKLPNGKWAGVEAQNAAELAKILGVKFSITDYSYDILPTTLAANKADIIGAQLFVTADRKKVISFSTPYYLSGQVFFVLKTSPFKTIGDLNKPEVRFVYGTGGAQGALAKQYIPKAKVSTAPLQGQLILYNFLASNQADVTMGEAAPMKVEVDRYKNLVAIGLHGRITTPRVAPKEMLTPFPVAFGLPKGDPAWTKCVNAWISNMKTSGRLNKRLDYWLAQKVT